METIRVLDKDHYPHQSLVCLSCCRGGKELFVQFPEEFGDMYAPAQIELINAIAQTHANTHMEPKIKIYDYVR